MTSVTDRPEPDNAALSELLLRAALDETDHRRRALERASKEAWRWGVEAADVVRAGRNLTELASVGPWVAAKIEAVCHVLDGTAPLGLVSSLMAREPTTE